MGPIMSKIISFIRDESGASAAEYALILAIVGIGIVTAAGALKNEIGGAMNRTADTIKTAS
jgi:pilus assembly protein Flp/PilA